MAVYVAFLNEYQNDFCLIDAIFEMLYNLWCLYLKHVFAEIYFNSIFYQKEGDGIWRKACQMSYAEQIKLIFTSVKVFLLTKGK